MVNFSFVDIQKTEDDDITEPVTLAEAKAQCRVDADYTDDDAFLTSLISQCRAIVENYCHISIVSKSIIATIEVQNNPKYIWASSASFKDRWLELELPYGPISEFDSLEYMDESGSVYTITPVASYFLLGSQFKNIKIDNNYYRLILTYKAAWPVIPFDLKLGILNEIAFRYESRGDPSNIRATAYTEEGVCQPARILIDKYVRYAWQ